MCGLLYVVLHGKAVHGCPWMLTSLCGSVRCPPVTCPHGDDPHTDTDVSEVQYLSCSHTSGSFTLSFRGQTTGSIAYNHVLGSALSTPRMATPWVSALCYALF